MCDVYSLLQFCTEWFDVFYMFVYVHVCTVMLYTKANKLYRHKTTKGFYGYPIDLNFLVKISVFNSFCKFRHNGLDNFTADRKICLRWPAYSYLIHHKCLKKKKKKKIHHKCLKKKKKKKKKKQLEEWCKIFDAQYIYSKKGYINIDMTLCFGTDIPIRKT